jgi:hypothetical protein
MAGYLSTDMFIQALKTAAKNGKSGITPANVQKAAMNQTWQTPGLAGPTIYPKATVSSYRGVLDVEAGSAVRVLEEAVQGRVTS